MRTILFLCTGNYYRSRFAEHYFNHQVQRNGLPWLAISRGLAIERGTGNVGPISSLALQALTQRGIPLPEVHRYPRAVDADDLLAADVVVALKEGEHRPLLAERFPSWMETVAYWHIHDLDCAPAEDALAQLASRLDRLVSDLAAMRHLARLSAIDRYPSLDPCFDTPYTPMQLALDARAI